LGLLREPETVATQVLTNLGLELEATRDIVRGLAAAQHSQSA
jgi:hypothetical protein